MLASYSQSALMTVHSLSVSLAAAAVTNNLIDIPLAGVCVKTLKWLVLGFLTPFTSALATVLCSLHQLRVDTLSFCLVVQKCRETVEHALMQGCRGHSNFFATLVPTDTIHDKHPDTLSNVSLHDCFETFTIASSSQSASTQKRWRCRMKICCT